MILWSNVIYYIIFFWCIHFIIDLPIAYRFYNSNSFNLIHYLKNLHIQKLNMKEKEEKFLSFDLRWKILKLNFTQINNITEKI